MTTAGAGRTGRQRLCYRRSHPPPYGFLATARASEAYTAEVDGQVVDFVWDNVFNVVDARDMPTAERRWTCPSALGAGIARDSPLEFEITQVECSRRVAEARQGPAAVHFVNSEASIRRIAFQNDHALSPDLATWSGEHLTAAPHHGAGGLPGQYDITVASLGGSQVLRGPTWQHPLLVAPSRWRRMGP